MSSSSSPKGPIRTSATFSHPTKKQNYSNTDKTRFITLIKTVNSRIVYTRMIHTIDDIIHKIPLHNYKTSGFHSSCAFYQLKIVEFKNGLYIYHILYELKLFYFNFNTHHKTKHRYCNQLSNNTKELSYIFCIRMCLLTTKIRNSIIQV